jgi:phosphate transport system substrate-binding protein
VSHRFELCTAAVLYALLAGTASADSINIQGSTTFARHILAQQEQRLDALSGHHVTVIPNKSLPGLIALMEGRAHLAMISAPLQTELAALNKAMPGFSPDNLVVHEIGRVKVSIVVHARNKVRKASLNDIRRILVGEIANWSELGGADLPIRVVLVGGGGGVTTVVQDQLLSGRQSTAPNLLYMKSPVQLVQVVEQEPGAIGFAQWELARQRFSPELETENPMEQILSLVTSGPPTPAMQEVIKAIRTIARGS